MEQNDNIDGDARPKAKRQRRGAHDDDGGDDEGNNSGVIDRHRQRMAFEEDATRIRSAMMTPGSAFVGNEDDDEDFATVSRTRPSAAASKQFSSSIEGGTTMGTNNEEPERVTTMQRRQGGFRPNNDDGGGSGGLASTRPSTADVSDGEENDDDKSYHWLRDYAPHHTRIGSDYQVAKLPPCVHAAIVPAAPSPVGDAVGTKRSCVSPGGSGH
jgi:hypothetical protein